LDFVLEKSKNSLAFAEIISKLLIKSGNIFPKESPINEYIFLISSSDPWYGYILVYIHTLKFPSSASHDEHRQICHQA
jgi:hypothetical protein